MGQSERKAMMGDGTYANLRERARPLDCASPQTFQKFVDTRFARDNLQAAIRPIANRGRRELRCD
jgi:hypothetical protein